MFGRGASKTLQKGSQGPLSEQTGSFLSTIDCIALPASASCPTCARRPTTMSKLSDYSKFDQIDSDTENSQNDDGDCVIKQSTQLLHSASGRTMQKNRSRATAAAQINTSTQVHPSIPGRYVFFHNNQKVYEWEQSLEEVILYIDAPTEQLPKEHVASHIVVNILPNQLQVGLKGRDKMFIDENTFDKVKVKESSWYIDEGVITIVLSKCFRGQTWEGVLCGCSTSTTVDGRVVSDTSGHQSIQESIDPLTKQEMQRTLMLERFHEENPGFDFRDATFNGEVPDPRTFMGGVKYS